MSDNEDYNDYNDEEDIDYNADDYAEPEDDVGFNLEDNFIQAENAEDPIAAYNMVIELEISNSNEYKWAYKCYEKLALIYIKRKNINEFESTIKNLSRNYNKVEDCIRQDTIRELRSEINTLKEKELKIEFLQILVKNLKENDVKRDYLWSGVDLCKLYSLTKNYTELKKLLPSLMEVVEKDEEKEIVKNIKLELIIMKMQILKYEGNNIDIKSLYLEANELMVDQVFEDKFLTGIITEEGGKIAMRQKDSKTALEKFKSAFHSYKENGNEEEAVTCLKYAFIISLMTSDSHIIVTKDEAKLNSNNKSLMRIVDLFDAFNVLDIKKVVEIWNKEIIPNESDKFILENKDDILYNIKINYVIRKLKAFKNCKFDIIEKEIETTNNELLGMIMYIAKNQMAKIKIDFVDKQLEIIDEISNSENKLLDNYNSWLDKMLQI